MAGFNDTTLGSQRIGFMQGGIKTEMCYIDFSNDVSKDNLIPSTLTNLLGWVGHVSVCEDAACVSAGFGKPITNMSLCTGPLLEISVNDLTVGTQTSEAKMTYIVWGW
jgi:hypothetical protein